MGAQCMALPDGRWHFQHGPIDIVLQAEGDADAVRMAHRQAWQRFETVLAELVTELPVLKSPVRSGPCPLQGPIAQRMWTACKPWQTDFITPMAAVAGAVAQELVGFYERDGIERAWINNGGDVAVHLSTGQSVRIGLYADLARLSAEEIVDGLRTDGSFAIEYATPVRGVATSGWRGRSLSRGIADSVTVLADSAARADAAATIIANAVDADDPGIVRQAACEVRDDTDLGSLPVTVEVPQLDPATVHDALETGHRRARELQAEGYIHACALVCQGQTRLLV